MLSGRWQQAAALHPGPLLPQPGVRDRGLDRTPVAPRTGSICCAPPPMPTPPSSCGASPTLRLPSARCRSSCSRPSDCCAAASGRRRSRRLITAAALAGAAASWLHPWQGLTLLIILAGSVRGGATATSLPDPRGARSRRRCSRSSTPRSSLTPTAPGAPSRAELAANTLAPVWALVAALRRAGRSGGLRRATAARRGRVDAVAVAGGGRSRIHPRAQHLAARAGRQSRCRSASWRSAGGSACALAFTCRVAAGAAAAVAAIAAVHACRRRSTRATTPTARFATRWPDSSRCSSYG